MSFYFGLGVDPGKAAGGLVDIGDLAFADALLHCWGLHSGCDGHNDPVPKVREVAVFAGPAGLALLDEHGLAPRNPEALFDERLVDLRLARSRGVAGVWGAPVGCALLDRRLVRVAGRRSGRPPAPCENWARAGST